MSLLKKKYHSAKQYQTSKEVVFDLSFQDYMTLWIKNVDALIHLDRAVRQAISSGSNKTIKLDYCLTWKPGFIRTGSPMNLKTTMITDKETSKKNCRLRIGEKKTEAAKAKLRKPKANTDNMRGPKAKWTEERKAARRAALAMKKKLEIENEEDVRRVTSHTTESKEKIIQRSKGKPKAKWTEERKSNARKPKSESQKAAMREAAKRRWAQKIEGRI